MNDEQMKVIAELYAENDRLERENKELHNKIDKAIEILKLCNSKCAKETIEILKGDVDE